MLLHRKEKMIITYKNYKGGINNLIVITEHLNPYINGITATSTKSVEHAIKNFKRKYAKQHNN